MEYLYPESKMPSSIEILTRNEVKDLGTAENPQTASTSSTDTPNKPHSNMSKPIQLHHQNLDVSAQAKEPIPTEPTALQRHIQFWDRDNDNIITPSDVYTGFRELGFSVLYSLGGLLINFFFSYPTRLAHSWLPDPFFRIYVDSIHKAKHGSDTGVYDSDGHFRSEVFDDMFAKLDESGTGSLGVRELALLLKKDRVVADPAGWSFAFMEWSTTWLLLQKEGRVWRDDLRQCYDGTLFWRIREERLKAEGWRQGYGWREFVRSVYKTGTWKEWELGHER